MCVGKGLAEASEGGEERGDLKATIANLALAGG
jgi:hypothetical protein